LCFKKIVDGEKSKVFAVLEMFYNYVLKDIQYKIDTKRIGTDPKSKIKIPKTNISCSIQYEYGTSHERAGDKLDVPVVRVSTYWTQDDKSLSNYYKLNGKKYQEIPMGKIDKKNFWDYVKYGQNISGTIKCSKISFTSMGISAVPHFNNLMLGEVDKFDATQLLDDIDDDDEISDFDD